MSIGKLEAPQMLTALAAAVCLAAAALLFVAFFSQVSVEGTSLAIDWRGVHKDFAGGTITYYNGLRNPPWSVLPLLPLGLLSMGASWGLLIFFTFLVLVISVPRHPRRAVFWLSVLLLTVSYPSLRHSADGNFEGLVIAGVLLLMVGYRARQPYLLAGGMLLASAKPHEAVLLLAVVALYLWQTWPPGEWLKAAGATALVVGPTLLWRGGEWFGALTGTYQQGSIMDISLWTALTRTGLVAPPVRALLWGGVLGATLIVAWRGGRTLSREKVGMLVSGSLLLSPYAAGNNILAVLALGIIPLFQARPLIGGSLIALADLPILIPPGIWYRWGAYYSTVWLLLAWGALTWRAWRATDGCQADAPSAR